MGSLPCSAQEPDDAMQSAIASGSVKLSFRQNPGALALIRRVLSSHGLPDLKAFQDMSATGEVHHYWAGKDVVGSAQLFALGSDQFRFDSSGDTPKILQIDGPRGQIRTGGQRQELCTASLVITRNPILPALELASALEDPNTTIEFARDVEAPSKAVAIAIERSDLDLPDFGPFRKLYFIDPSSLNITSTIETVAFSLQDKLSRQYVYKDFMVVQGITIPTTVSEFVSGQHTWDLHLTNIAINSGVSSDALEF